jgi:hypothetical protein
MKSLPEPSRPSGRAVSRTPGGPAVCKLDAGCFEHALKRDEVQQCRVALPPFEVSDGVVSDEQHARQFVLRPAA